MTESRLEGLEGEAQLTAARRSQAYGLFARAWEYPEAELRESITSGELAERLCETLASIDPALVEDADRQALAETGAGDDLEVEYTRLFDVGPSGPPCPLHGGLYGGARMKVMEEAVRFYNHFGLSLSESPRELPDHLTTELEFLHYLSFREAQALQAGEDAEPFRRARRDFVERHAGRWIPRLRERLEAQDAAPFFRELARRLERLLLHEKAQLDAELGPARPGGR